MTCVPAAYLLVAHENIEKYTHTYVCNNFGTFIWKIMCFPYHTYLTTSFNCLFMGAKAFRDCHWCQLLHYHTTTYVPISHPILSLYHILQRTSGHLLPNQLPFPYSIVHSPHRSLTVNISKFPPTHTLFSVCHFNIYINMYVPLISYYHIQLTHTVYYTITSLQIV